MFIYYATTVYNGQLWDGIFINIIEFRVGGSKA